MAVRIGELLLKEKRITAEQLQSAILHQRSNGGSLAQNLVSLGHVRDEEITALLSRQFGVPAIDLTGFEVDPFVKKLVPAETARKHQLVPLSRAGATLTVAMTDPTNVFAMDDVKFMTGYNVEPVVASESGIRGLIERCYGRISSAKPPNVGAERSAVSALEVATRSLEVTEIDTELVGEGEEIVASLARSGEEAPVIKLVNAILMGAITKGASDIHIEPYKQELMVRYRIDGVVHKIMSPPLKMRDAITSRIKIMAKLDIAEKRLAQDGRIKIRFADNGKTRDVDCRVSCLPTLYGERIAMRILESADVMRDLNSLGLDDESLRRVENVIAKSSGLVLITGPNGSGKTTTLYALLARINTAGKTIMTAEEPIEFELPGIAQVQVRENIGLTFSAALRTFMRQDGDAFLIGELRDLETAEAAMKAALTGKLVLSSMHTDDAPSTLSRLANMGLQPFLISSAVSMICAQRLVRKVCTTCGEPDRIPPAALESAGFSAFETRDLAPRRGAGCEKCSNTGYLGRTGLFEVLLITEGIGRLVMKGAPAADIRKQAEKEGMLTLRKSGLQKVKAGVTTLEEVIRQTGYQPD